MQGHLKININLFSALCPPQLHKKLVVTANRLIHLYTLFYSLTLDTISLQLLSVWVLGKTIPTLKACCMYYYKRQNAHVHHFYF
jgi:hypothetical protein